MDILPANAQASNFFIQKVPHHETTQNCCHHRFAGHWRRLCGRPVKRADPGDQAAGPDQPRHGRTRQEALFRSAPVQVRLHLLQQLPQPVDGRHRQHPDLDRRQVAAGPDQRTDGAQLQPQRRPVLGRSRRRPQGAGRAARSPTRARWPSPHPGNRRAANPSPSMCANSSRSSARTRSASRKSRWPLPSSRRPWSRRTPASTSGCWARPTR
jgi:hypothetical protein